MTNFQKEISLTQRIKELEAELENTLHQLTAYERHISETDSILSNAPLLILLISHEKKIKKINKKVLHYLGRKEKEIIGRSGGEALNCIHHLDSDEGCGFGPACASCGIRALIHDTLTTGRSHYQTEVSITTNNVPGKTIYLLVTTVLLGERNQGDTLVYIEDITERKLTEQSLRESRQRAELLFYHTPIMIHSIDTQGRLLEVNEEWLNKLGYTREEVIGRYSADFMTPESNKSVTRHIRPKFLNTGFAFREPVKFLTKKGEIIHTLCSARAGYTDSGDISYSLAVFEDVTQSLKTEQALKQSEALLNEMGAIAQVGGWELDLEKNEMNWTQETFRIHGATHNLPLSLQTIIDIFRPEDQAALSGSLRLCMEQGVPFDLELSHGDKPSWTRLICTPEIADGKVIKLSGTMQDITDRKRYDQIMVMQRDLGIKLGNSETLDQALEACLDFALIAGDADGGGIYLKDQKTGGLDLVAHKGLPVGFPAKVKHYSSDSNQVRLVNNGEPIYLSFSEYLQQARQDDGRSLSKLFSSEFKSIGIIPIRYKDQIIAALNVASKSDYALNEQNRFALESIAAQIAGALMKIQSDQALKTSRLNLQILFESLNDFLFVLDANGNLLDHNPVVKQRLGYTDEELATLNVLDLHPENRREEAAEIVRQMLAGKTKTCPIPLQTKTGDLIPVETKVSLGSWYDKEAIFGISRDITERLEAENAKQLSEERLLAAIDAIDEGFALYDVHDNLAMCNAKYRELYSVSADLLVIGNNFEDILRKGIERGQYPEAEGREEEWLAERLAFHRQASSNLEQKLQDGRWLKISERMMRDGSVVGFRVDITDVKRSEEQARLALIEKETLLREIHHRVKNNMQVVTSLLSLQSQNITDKEVLEIFAEAESRVHSMSLVHEILYKSSRLDKIRAQEYFESLTSQLSHIYYSSRNRVTCSVLADGVYLNIDHAVPCGLIATELLTNAYKYAFPSTQSGTVEVQLSITQDNWIQMSIMDNGIGLPVGFDPKTVPSLGVRLVTELVEDQLEGTWEVATDNGTCWHIQWPLPDPKEND